MLFFFFICKLSAQHFITSSQVDTIDVRGVFINPSMSSVIEPQVLLGNNFYHAGFLNEDGLALRHTYFNLSIRNLPRIHTGFSLNVAQLSTPIYARTDFTVGLSKQMLKNFYIGTNFKVIHSGFNQSKFDLIHENDPLLQNGAQKTLFTPGVGIFYRLNSDIGFASSVNYLNQPNQAVGNESAPLPRVIDLEMSWSRNLYHITIGGEMINSSFHPTMMFHLDYWDRIQFYSGYNYSGIELGSWFHLSARMMMHYGVNIPISELSLHSYGSHQVNFVFRLREPEIPLRLFDIDVETDTLFIYEEWYHPEFDSLLADTIKSYDFFKPQPHFTQEVNRDSIIPGFSKRYFTKSYLSYLDTMTNQLETHKIDSLRFIVTENDLNRAGGVRRYLMRNNLPEMPLIGIYKRDHQIKHSDIDSLHQVLIDTIRSDIHRVYLSKPFQRIWIESNEKMRIRYWRLEILDDRGNIVFAEEGKGGVPNLIDWPWENNEGRLIEPKRYFVIFKWKDQNDTFQNTNRLSVVVIKKAMHIYIDVSNDFKKELNDYDGVDVLMREIE
ncbi:type IX secretion system membrane protein PorP/SprF [candidate division KSB1 bacterium]|nr:type IX secretion system membrane protein PorP/SprF [candidate division KSB1 bacterium]